MNITAHRNDWNEVYETFAARGTEQDHAAAALIAANVNGNENDIITIDVPMSLWRKRILTWPDFDLIGSPEQDETTEITLTVGSHTITVRADPCIDADTGAVSWTEAVFEGAEAWDGSGMRYETPAICIGQTVRDILDSIDA